MGMILWLFLAVSRVIGPLVNLSVFLQAHTVQLAQVFVPFFLDAAVRKLLRAHLLVLHVSDSYGHLYGCAPMYRQHAGGVRTDYL